ncbi:ApeI family dehydratase [Colwellia sp. 12G3]|uniref:ApeI family dehydratase n=1 Tax=Colwellia sp. 12G3 TaxID=2058299 RepID=UPI000C33169B|nr:acyl-CoA synthetase [Colwellia sp. 12G3]PKI13862.1 acyl-CoA synthetase [Colwellia sp. 12G3]
MTDFVYQAELELIEHSSNRVELNLTIPENLYYFQGHFSEAPILPGVTQLDWVMNYLAQYFAIDISTLVSVDALKFQHIVRPGYQVNLTLEKIKPNKYSFSYLSDHGQHASGKVVFA